MCGNHPDRKVFLLINCESAIEVLTGYIPVYFLKYWGCTDTLNDSKVRTVLVCNPGNPVLYQGTFRSRLARGTSQKYLFVPGSICLLHFLT